MKLSECERCSLRKKRIQVVKPLIIGNIQHVFFCGESPGKNEDKYGKPFYDGGSNTAGHWHWKIANKLGVENNCIVMNTVQCRPVAGNKNGKPTSIQIEKCSIWIKKVVNKYSFRLMILYGTFPIQLVLGASPPIRNVVGRFYETSYFGKKLVCFAMYHPATLVYDNKKYMPIFTEHICKIKAYLQN